MKGEQGGGGRKEDRDGGAREERRGGGGGGERERGNRDGGGDRRREDGGGARYAVPAGALDAAALAYVIALFPFSRFSFFPICGVREGYEFVVRLSALEAPFPSPPIPSSHLTKASSLSLSS